MMHKKDIFKVLIGLAIIGYLVYRFDLRQVGTTISSANPGLLILSLLIYSFTFLILVNRWRLVLLHMNASIPLAPAYQSFVGGVLISDITPSRVGDLTRPILAREYIDLNKGFASVIIDRYTDILTLLTLSSIGLLLMYIHKMISGGIVIYLFIAFSALTFALLIGTLLLWFQPEWMINLIKKIGDRFGTYPINLLLQTVESVSLTREPKKLLASCFLLTCLAWIMHATRVELIASSVGVSVPFIFLFLLLPLISALSLLPVSPAGLGLVEGGLAALLSLFGIPLYVGLSIALLDRALTVFFHILVGSRYSTRLVELVHLH